MSTLTVGVVLLPVPVPPDGQVSDPDPVELELDPPDAEVDVGQVATVPTEATTPGVVRLSGSVMVTLSPTDTSD
jgi:hypothetical protein